MSLSIEQLRPMQDRVGRGETRPLAWRLDQLQRFQALVENHEQEVLLRVVVDTGPTFGSKSKTNFSKVTVTMLLPLAAGTRMPV